MNEITNLIYKFLPTPVSRKNVSDLEIIFKRELMIFLLKSNLWNKTKVANLLGINRNTLSKKMRLLGIDNNVTE